MEKSIDDHANGVGGVEKSDQEDLTEGDADHHDDGQT
jgi:hypothetical protein